MSVFDTSAVMAILLREAGQAQAEAWLGSGVMSLVNVAETAGQLVQQGSTAAEALAAIDALGLEWIQIDAPQVERVAELRTIKNLALGDRFCIALAEARAEPLITADQVWTSLPLKVPVELIR